MMPGLQPAYRHTSKKREKLFFRRRGGVPGQKSGERAVFQVQNQRLIVALRLDPRLRIEAGKHCLSALQAVTGLHLAEGDACGFRQFLQCLHAGRLRGSRRCHNHSGPPALFPDQLLNAIHMILIPMADKYKIRSGNSFILHKYTAESVCFPPD